MAETRKVREMRELDSPELADLLEAKREELFRLRLNWFAGSLENPNQMRIVRKEIARILTVLHERDLAREIVGEEDTDNAEQSS